MIKNIKEGVAPRFLKRCVGGWLCVVLLAACTPVEQVFTQATNEPSITEKTIETGDGHQLPLRVWAPEEKPEAVLIALHGFNDYSNAFKAPGEFMQARGIALLAYDQRGFGQTDHHGIWAGNANLKQDVYQAIKAATMFYPDTPIYLLGESMGGAVAIAAMTAYDMPELKGAILSAPAVWGDETMNAMYRGTLWLMAHTFPQMKLTGRGLKILASDNIDMLRQMSKDPLIIKETRVDAIYGIVHLMDEAYQNIGNVDKPVLLLYGANDQVIPKAPVKNAIDRFTVPHRVAYYPDGYHMLLRDLKGDIVMNDIVSWIKYQERPLPSGYDQNWEERLE